jgi:protocatechuate 3,4-dioxygenase beta subunit
MPRLGWAFSFVVAICVLAATAAALPVATPCTPTLDDGFGPFGRGTPPARARIGSGHVLNGLILSALDCKPIARARVELWQRGKNGYTRAGSATVFTNRAGRFRFEGPFPTRYGGGQPHIHLRVSAPVHRQLLTRYEPPPGAARGTIRLVLAPVEL